MTKGPKFIPRDRAGDWKQAAAYEHRGHPGRSRSMGIQVAGPETEVRDWHCFCNTQAGIASPHARLKWGFWAHGQEWRKTSAPL